ncbi:helix-turn-helix domain-containing protein [Apilactobacillus xinyiensis]|uniref:helix-turn-helix domain-containing protein n=1 Tax=Apilactobacillus xinyiensis TaxID=2841032 RepID=UPI001C7DB93E|nr:helix-turn-helix domain-containing protein [Apilactobacillus xinyiensis]
MSKYSTKIKIEIAKHFLNNENSVNGLAKKYNISYSIVRRWCILAKHQGLMALQVKHYKQSYSIEFKIDVVKYYLTNEAGIESVASKFNINASQMYSWKQRFNKFGIAGLKNVKKGRPAMKSKIKSNEQRNSKNIGKLALSEKEQYEEKISKLEKKIYDLELSNYCLKGLQAMMKDYQTK